jgi:hypothetical protein
MSNDLIEKIKSVLKNKPVQRAYLFGSSVRTDYNAESDVDILVELDYSKPIGLEFIKMKLQLEDILKREVDLLTTKSISKYIKTFIDQEKVLIYEK